MSNLFSLLYPLVALISASAYFPQITALLRACSAPVDISIRSWLLWIAGSSITLGYAFFCVHDVMFCLITLFNLVMMIVIVGLVLYKRYVVFGHCRSLAHAFVEYFLCYPFFCVREEPLLKPVPIRTENARALSTDSNHMIYRDNI